MKLNYKRTVLIGFAFLSICSFWQMYDNIIPLILKDTFHLGETVTGVIMALDNVLALFLLPLFGMLSDKVDTRMGKRTPFIVAGTVLAIGFLMLLHVANERAILPLFIIVLLLLLVSMGLYRSPAVALMPDVTPKTLRSKGNAVINLMGAVGGVYTLIMIKLLVGKGERPNYLPLFLSIAGIMLVSIVILVATIRENKLCALMPKDTAEEKEAQAKGGRLAPDVQKSLIFMLLSVSLWYIAYNAVTTAFSRYATHVWGLEGGGYANCLMVATVAAIISYIPIGSLSSKIGRKKTILIGVVLLALCYLVAGMFSTFHPIMNLFFAIIGFAWSAINVNSFPMVVEMSASGDIGKYTGYYYTFSMAAQVITPILSGFFLEYVSYRTLFPYAVIFSCLAFCTMLMVKHVDSRPEKKDSVLENFDVDD